MLTSQTFVQVPPWTKVRDTTASPIPSCFQPDHIQTLPMHLNYYLLFELAQSNQWWLRNYASYKEYLISHPFHTSGLSTPQTSKSIKPLSNLPTLFSLLLQTLIIDV
jgi:hypothetical protein